MAKVEKNYKPSTINTMLHIEYKKNFISQCGENVPKRLSPTHKILFDNGFDPIANKKYLKKHRDNTYQLIIDNLPEAQMLELAEKYFVKLTPKNSNIAHAPCWNENTTINF